MQRILLIDKGDIDGPTLYLAPDAARWLFEKLQPVDVPSVCEVDGSLLGDTEERSVLPVRRVAIAPDEFFASEQLKHRLRDAYRLPLWLAIGSLVFVPWVWGLCAIFSMF
ncbi:MAG: hypothetical protein ACYS9X_27285 [Planctomycetota bacterium]|jgi:hypothetical protein